MAISTNDAYNLSELSEQPINIDTTTLSEACNTWTKAVTTADIDPQKIVSAFEPLTSLGIAGEYINGLAKALEKINNSIVRVSGDIDKAGKEQESVDTGANNNAQNGYRYTGGRNGTNNNKGGSGNNNNNNAGKDNPDDSNADNKKEEIDINKVIEEIDHLPDESFIKFMEALEALPEGKITEYITDKEYSKELLKILLESPNVPESFKALVKDIDESLIQGVIQAILLSKGNVSDFAKNAIINYMKTADGQADLTAASEATDSTKIQDKFYNKVDDMYKDIDEILSKNGVSDSLLEIYDGGNETISTETMNLLRGAIDDLAASNNVTYTELLSRSNEKMLTDNLESLRKSLSYFKLMNKFDSTLSSQIFLSYME